MPAAELRSESTISPVSVAPSTGTANAVRTRAAARSSARLADERAVPAPSPVHQLQAELVQLTTLPETETEQLYPGWFRLTFLLAASVLLWAAILWGVSRLT